jgi:uncharacterized protein involved in exopolysaccharide biosynthesis
MHQNDQGNAGTTPPGDGYAIRLYPIAEEKELRLAELWRVVVDGRWLVAALAVGGAVLAIAASFLITPVFRAQVVMAPVTIDRTGGAFSSLAGQLGGFAALAGVNLAADDTSVKSIATLRSRDFTERFIRKNNLMPVLFAEHWDAASGAWNVSDAAETPDMWDAFDRFDQSVRGVEQDVETGLVTVTVDWTDAAIARDWANRLVDDVNLELRARAIDESKRRIEYLQGRLKETTEVELRAAVFGLVEAEMKNAMLSAVRTDFAFDVIDPAVAPQKRYWPNRGLLAVLGFAAGALIGLVWVFVRRALRA